MTPDTAKLLHLIATEPLILAVRLADKLDCDTDDIESALLPHINRRVFGREVTGPNGRKATAYVLSDEYRAEVLAGQAARDPDVERRAGIREAAPALRMDAACDRIQPPAPCAAPPVPPVPRITKPQMAISFLKAAPGNRCTTKQLLAQLGLPLTSSPNAYLREALKDGRIKRDGQDWTLGDGKPAPLDNVEAVGNIIVATKDASPIPQAVVDAVATAPVLKQAVAIVTGGESAPTRELAAPPADTHEMLTFHPMSSIGDINSQEKGSGARYNGGKPDFSLIPMTTLEDEVRVWMYGRDKYAAWNWTKGMAWSVPFACAMRHMAAWQRGEECDPESGLPHLAHAMCNLRMLTLYAKTYTQGDDRPVKELQP